MKIPSSIKIGGATYQVILQELDDSSGKTDFSKSIIYLDNRQSKDQIEATFIHEIFHCINNQMSEERVEFLAQACYQILKDNFNEGRRIFKKITRIKRTTRR